MGAVLVNVKNRAMLTYSIGKDDRDYLRHVKFCVFALLQCEDKTR